MRHVYRNIQPGDIGFDEGVGISGWFIRTGTKSAYGHCWIYHQLVDIVDGVEVWDTVESGPRRGTIHRLRTVTPNKVVRIWQDEYEQRDIVRASEKLVGLRYGWGEIIRIVARIFGIRLRRWRDNPFAIICSNHVAQAALAGRPDLGFYLRFEPNEVWPGELAETFDSFIWDTEIA